MNGAIVPITEAAVSPLDIGLLRGYAVFDLLRTVGGRPFLLAQHLERLHASASALGLALPVSDRDIGQAIDDLLQRNRHAEATVRLVLTGGVSPDGMSFDPSTPTLIIMTHDLHEPAASVYDNGVRLKLVEHIRELPHAKTTNYLTALATRLGVHAEGAFDILYHANGIVSEAATASVYFLSGSRLCAPQRDVLPGTIGALVLEHAAHDYEIVYTDVRLQDARAADEILLTSTTRGVVPVVALDDHVIGKGVPGPLAKELIAYYRELLASRGVRPHA